MKHIWCIKYDILNASSDWNHMSSNTAMINSFDSPNCRCLIAFKCAVSQLKSEGNAEDAAGLRQNSPRLLERPPERTDFIGCFPSRSLRCQQQKNKIVAIVPIRSSNKSSTYWILYGLSSTKNAAAIIIGCRYGADPLLHRLKLQMRRKTLADTLEASHSHGRGASGVKRDNPDHWYHCCEVQCMTQHRRTVHLFIYFTEGKGESADLSQAASQ